MGATKEESKLRAASEERSSGESVSDNGELSKITKKSKRNRHRKRNRKDKRKKTGFLDLPGELRNMIYEHALVQPKTVEITAKGPGEPALLQVNKEIRGETRKMYYMSNKFSFFVHNAEGAAFTPFVKQASEFLDLETKPFGFRMAGEASFKNLIKWVKAHQHQGGIMPIYDAPETTYEAVMAAALKMVQPLSHLPWKVQKQVLLAFYDGLKGTDSEWVKEYDRVGQWEEFLYLSGQSP